jgi:hypothetical protein
LPAIIKESKPNIFLLTIPGWAQLQLGQHLFVELQRTLVGGFHG